MPFHRPPQAGRALSAFVATVIGFLMAASLTAADVRTFQARGVVEKLDPERGEVVVRHDAIPGYMDAMTMPFRPRAKEEMAKLKPGDAITFRLSVTAHDGWIDDIKVLSPTASIPRTESAPHPLPDLTIIQLGHPFPETTLTDETGQEFNLSSYRGQALAVTFIFTRCPYPTFCPLITENFTAVQNALAADPAAPKNWQLLSITIDPDRDTPEALKAYATLHKANPIHWRFATGSLRAITTLALRCGLNFWDENGQIQHNLRTVVVDANGKVRRVFPDNHWKPEDLAAELRGAAIPQP